MPLGGPASEPLQHTEGKQAMDAREKAGRREASAERRAAVYETLLDAQNEVGLGFLLLDDTTFSVISLNEAYCRITGYTEAELRAKPSLMALAEPTEAAVWRHLSERAAAGEVPRIFETALIHKNGQRVEVEVSSKRALLEGRGVIVSLVRDITEQKRAVEALKESKLQLEEAQATANVGTWEWDVKENRVTWSPMLYRIYGVDPRTHMPSYENYIARIHPEDRERVARATEAALKEPKPYAHDERILRPDGEVRVLYTWTRPVFDGHGKLVRLVGVCQDITERKRWETQLEGAVSLLEATLEATADGILVVDTAGRITRFNQRFAKMWAIPAQVLETHEDEKALAYAMQQLKEPEAFLSKVRELYAKPGTDSFDTLEFKDGRVIERLSRAQRIEGRIVGRVWSFRDVTARKRAEAALREREQQERERTEGEREREIGRLREMAEYKAQALNMVAHEVNTPLTVLKLNLDMLKAANRLTGADATLLNASHQAVSRLVRLVADVLAVSRLQAGRLALRLAETDLAAVVEAAAKPFAGPAKKAGIELQVEVQGPLSVEADSDRITQVVVNLVTNALKFTPMKGRLVVAAQAEQGEAVVHVRDTGVGLTAEQLERLFAPFYSVQDPVHNPEGTGLGLYISKGIVEAHHGRLWATSDGPGRGCTFSFALPLATGGSDHPEAPPT